MPVSINGLYLGGLYFGRRKPSSDEVSLNAGRELASRSAAVPSEGLLDEIVRRVSDRDPALPRFAVVPNVRGVFPDVETVREFQKNVLNGVVAALRQVAPEVLAVQEYVRDDTALAETQTLSGKPKDAMIERLNIETFDGYGYNEYDLDGEPGKWQSTKSFHTDQLRHLIASLTWGPIENIRGGRLKVLDLREMAQNLGLASPIELLDQRTLRKRAASHAGVLKTRYDQPDKTDPATRIVADNRDLVIFNNRIDAGVMHGVTQPVRKNPKKPAVRQVHYVSYMAGPEEHLK